MRHYSTNNVELLTTQRLMFDGELSRLKQAGKIEQLMMKQSACYDALETTIADLEEVKNELRRRTKRAPEREAAAQGEAGNAPGPVQKPVPDHAPPAGWGAHCSHGKQFHQPRGA